MEEIVFPKRYMVTSALPYANGPLHLGHLAGAYLSADAYVRFLRLMGKDVLYVCGSDEYGAAISIKARKEGVTPKEIVDEYHTLIKRTFDQIGMSFDIYHRTSADIHAETAQEFFRKLYKNGSLIEKKSEQFYDEEANMFLADRYIQGTCPQCGFEGAFGDQCESCGTSLSPTELINPRSVLTDTEPVLRETVHWYLPLDKDEAWLREYIKKGKLDGKQHHDPSLWKPHVTGQCLSWIDNGLVPRSMTRDLDWGIDVPHEIEGSEGKKLYVWMDAPIGYISASKQWALDHDRDWKKYWQDEETELIHFIGKDNIVFHCIIFPAILKTHGQYILPKNVPANQFLNLEGRKLSTSKGWAVWVHEYLEDLPGKEDVLRYSLYKNMPEQRDAEFTWKGWQAANNNELVNNLGNFINRVMVLTNKYYEGIVPDYDPDLDFSGSESEDMPSWHDSEMLVLFDQLDAYSDRIRKFDFRGALRILMDISSGGNTILQQNEPWRRRDDDPDQVKVVMNISLQYATVLSVALQPFLPFTADKLRNMLNLDPISGDGDLLELMGHLAEGDDLIPSGHQIGEPAHLFSRIDDEVVEAQLNKLYERSKSIEEPKEEEMEKEAQKYVDESAEIQFEDFMKLDLRVAQITAAEKVENTDRLMKISLDVGYDQRTVVSGIAQEYNADEIIGQRVIYVANLAPKKLRGVLSHGMILMAEGMDGKLSFVAPQDDLAAGCKVT